MGHGSASRMPILPPRFVSILTIILVILSLSARESILSRLLACVPILGLERAPFPLSSSYPVTRNHSAPIRGSVDIGDTRVLHLSSQPGSVRRPRKTPANRCRGRRRHRQ